MIQSSMYYRTEPGNTFAWITTDTRTNFCKAFQSSSFRTIWRGVLWGPLDAIFRNDMHGYLYPKLAVGYMRDITHMGGYTVRYIRACRGQIGQEGGVYPPLLQVSTHPSFPPCALWKKGGQILPKLKGSTKSSGSKKYLHLSQFNA